jgi:hypothetical protein
MPSLAFKSGTDSRRKTVQDCLMRHRVTERHQVAVVPQYPMGNGLPDRGRAVLTADS